MSHCHYENFTPASACFDYLSMSLATSACSATWSRVERRQLTFSPYIRGPHRLWIIPSTSAFWPQKVVGMTALYGESTLRGWVNS